MQDEEDKVSQVFFKKMKESEFENMKLDSPKLSNKTSSISQIDSMNFPFEDKESEINKKDNNEEKNNGGMNLWNWRLTGLGAICSFGVAAAAVTICIFIGKHQKQKQHKQNQKLKFQFSDEKVCVSLGLSKTVSLPFFCTFYPSSTPLVGLRRGCCCCKVCLNFH